MDENEINQFFPFARERGGANLPDSTGLASGRRQSPHRNTSTVDSNSVVVHLLVNNRMACGFDSRPPELWPKGQIWVRLDKAEMLSCAGCMKAAAELKQK